MADANCNWDYGLEHGPAHWSDCNVLCDDGLVQSPINIETPKLCDNSRDELDVSFSQLSMILSQETNVSGDQTLTYKLSVEENEANEQTMRLLGEQYKLAQFHFHTPAEHTINGKQFPGCVHLVHTNKDPSADPAYAVIEVGLDYSQSTKSQTLAGLMSSIDSSGSVTKSTHSLDLSDLVPANIDAYTYLGSFTTPPCTEGVQFVISDKALGISESDFAKLDLIKGTARATQNLNFREISCASASCASAYGLMLSISTLAFTSLVL